MNWSPVLQYYPSQGFADAAIDMANPTDCTMKIFYDPKVDTREGYKGDVEHLTEMLAKVARKSPNQLLWIELWDMSCLEEYKTIIVNTLKAADASLDLVNNVRFYHIGDAPVAAPVATTDLRAITAARVAADGPDVAMFNGYEDYVATAGDPVLECALISADRYESDIKRAFDRFDANKPVDVWIELRGPAVCLSDIKKVVEREIAARSLCLHVDRVHYCRIVKFDATHGMKFVNHS